MVKAPGIPNITGTFLSCSWFDAVNYTPTGAFYENGKSARAAGYDEPRRVNAFDASRCSTIYGASNTVQPPAIQLIPQIRF